MNLGSNGGMSVDVMQAAVQALNLAPGLGTYTTLFQGTFDMSLTTDQAFTIPTNLVFATYVPLLVVATKASAPILLSTGGIYTGASKSGIAVVAASQIWTGLTGSTKAVKPTLSVAGQDLISGTTLYLSLTTPMGSPATAYISVMGLPGN